MAQSNSNQLKIQVIKLTCLGPLGGKFTFRYSKHVFSQQDERRSLEVG